MQHDSGSFGASTTNLAEFVRQSAARSGDRPALLFRDETITWRELDASVDAIARGLATLGHAPGDRVAVALGNTPDFVRTYFGILRAGLVAVPVNPGYRARELAHVLADSAARTLIATGDVVQEANRIREELPALEHQYAPGGADHGTSDLGELAVPLGEPAAPGSRGDDLAVLLYTSGSEGNPKGAML
ncbi:MAG: AMP-binding protein, partial [Micromonosporaceae bacterium]